MQITIDPNAGYCFGVVKAITVAECALQQDGRLYCLGDIVHNSEEVERLKREGLEVIGHQDMPDISHSKMLIRAHGEPPHTYDMAKQYDIEVIDATCPIVLTLQEKIKRGYEEMKKVDGQVVIYGKKGHAEVTGLNGQADDNAIIISNLADISDIDMGKPIRMYSQTTMNRADYQALITAIKENLTSDIDFIAYDTVCRRVANRVKDLEQFAINVDLMLFVAGANSSNGQYLYQHCKKVQPNTILINSREEVDYPAIIQASNIGISGATSTPRWLMEAIKGDIEGYQQANISQP